MILQLTRENGMYEEYITVTEISWGKGSNQVYFIRVDGGKGMRILSEYDSVVLLKPMYGERHNLVQEQETKEKERNKNYLGRNIKFLRLDRAMTQRELAELLGMESGATVQKWEAGISAPRVDTVQRLADTFGVSVGSLFDEELGGQNDA